ncbi:MAG: hypothetical protein JWM00_590 [Candidatus Saccharibacteria bacterium]|nr:hypothetical protein [Candidatus Saccharibacteria bacterium]
MKRWAVASISLCFILSSILPAASTYALDEALAATESSSTMESIVDADESTISATESLPLETLPSSELEAEATFSTSMAAAAPLIMSQQSGVVISLVQTRSAGGNASDELIELYNNSDSTIDVTDWCLKRASATGTSYTKLVCITGEQTGKEFRVMLPPRSYVLAVSTVSSLAGFDFKFTAGLTDTGGRIALFNHLDQKQDLLAWGATAVEFETAPFISSAGLLMQRKNVSPGVYQDTDNNATDFEAAPPHSSYTYGALSDDIDYCLNIDGSQATIPSGWSRDSATGNCVNMPVNLCPGLNLSEIGANMSGQFIELYNASIDPLMITNCKLQTNRSDAQVSFPDQVMEPHGFLIITIADSGLTLTKTTTGTVYLLSSDGATELQTVSYADLAENTSWAWFGEGDWRQTYSVTRGTNNLYQQYASCEAGWERNADTGMCRKLGGATSLVTCKEGQYRSEETNRCRSIASAAASVLKPCADDQFRNPATNRCKAIASSDDVADCGEGRERNPTTNRCRNVVHSDVPAAAFAVEPIKDSATAFVWWWVLGGAAALAFGYGGWEWRREIVGALFRASMLFRAKR